MSSPGREIIQRRNQLFLEGLYLCGKCSEVKPLLEFGSNKRGRHGIQTWCKVCLNASNMASSKKKIEEIGHEAWRAKKNHEQEKWRKNTRHKRLDHFKRQERESNYRQNYGITIADFDRLLAEQDGRCAICCTPKPQRKWHVDHCHETGEVRGILCNLCNVAIGAFKENQDALEMARIYLRPRGMI